MWLFKDLSDRFSIVCHPRSPQRNSNKLLRRETSINKFSTHVTAWRTLSKWLNISPRMALFCIIRARIFLVNIEHSSTTPRSNNKINSVNLTALVFTWSFNRNFNSVREINVTLFLNCLGGNVQFVIFRSLVSEQDAVVALRKYPLLGRPVPQGVRNYNEQLTGKWVYWNWIIRRTKMEKRRPNDC